MPDETKPSAPTPAMPPPPMPAGYAADSGYPRRSKHFQSEPGGFYASNKVWGAIVTTVLGLITGGATYSGWQLVTKAHLDKRMATEQKAREDGDAKLATDMVGLTVKVDSVQTVQHLDVAQRNARRVVREQIECRRNDDGCERRKINELERIRRLNMERLQAKKPKPPCADLACSN